MNNIEISKDKLKDNLSQAMKNRDFELVALFFLTTYKINDERALGTLKGLFETVFMAGECETYKRIRQETLSDNNDERHFPDKV